MPNLRLLLEDSDRRKFRSLDRRGKGVRLVFLGLVRLAEFLRCLLPLILLKRRELNRREAVRAFDAATSELCLWSHSRIADFAVRGDVSFLFLR